MNKQQIGASKRRLRKTLTAKGFKEDAIAETIAATFGGERAKALMALPRPVARQLLMLLNEGGKGTAGTVVWCKSGRFRVYSSGTYNNIVKNGQRLGKLPKKKK